MSVIIYFVALVISWFAGLINVFTQDKYSAFIHIILLSVAVFQMLLSSKNSEIEPEPNSLETGEVIIYITFALGLLSSYYTLFGKGDLFSQENFNAILSAMLRNLVIIFIIGKLLKKNLLVRRIFAY